MATIYYYFFSKTFPYLVKVLLYFLLSICYKQAKDGSFAEGDSTKFVALCVVIFSQLEELHFFSSVHFHTAPDSKDF